jgi:transcriptional regulator with XRE-family HTH domain
MLGNQLARNLVNERKKRSMTIKAFAKFLGISPSTLFAWETGANPRNPQQLREISIRLKLPLLFLIFGEEERVKQLSSS